MTNRIFNLYLGLFILYGVLVNVGLAYVLSNYPFSSEQIIGILILSLVCGIAGVFVALKNDEPIVSFLGYNMLVIPFGLAFSIVLQAYAPGVIFEAFLLTAIIMFIMMIAATIKPEWFRGLGTTLFIGLIGLIIAEIVCLFMGISPTWISAFSAALFSLYIGYDWVQAQEGLKTLDAAIDAALSIYLDVINLFLDLLKLLGDID